VSKIRVVRGVGQASTAMGSYDTALADANLHNYNLIHISSVIPAEASIEMCETAPQLGSAGDTLTVVQARKTIRTDSTAVAGLGWATGDGPGIFYEATGTTTADVRDDIETGLTTGKTLRSWDLSSKETLIEKATGAAQQFTTVVVIAAYGTGNPIS
jgi:arginine decarboxylase